MKSYPDLTGICLGFCIAVSSPMPHALAHGVNEPGGSSTVASSKVPQSLSANDHEALRSLAGAIGLLKDQFVDEPNWLRIMVAALRGLQALRPGEFDVAETPGEVRLLHRSVGGAEKTISFSFSAKRPIEQVPEHFIKAVQFATTTAGVGLPDVINAFIDGLNALSNRKSGAVPRAPTTEAEPQVLSSDLGSAHGYLKIGRFRDGTADDVVRVINELTARGATGVVLDLRGNQGGSFQSAVDVAGLFLAPGAEVAHSKGRAPESNARLTGRSASSFLHLPVVVLIDGATAAGAEVVAGGLRDARETPLIGEKTAGNGFVVSIYRLENGARLFLTTAQWFTPKGTSVDGAGLSPDVEILSGPTSSLSRPDPGTDVQLARAIEALNQIVNGAVR